MNIKRLYLFALAGAVSLLAGCQKDDVPTTVVGTVTNKYTGEPVAAVAIVVEEPSSSIFGSTTVYNQVAAAQTDAQGQYRLQFGSHELGTYLVKMHQPDLFDLELGYNEHHEIQPASVTHLNFEVTPYKTVTVNVPAGKAGKEALLLRFESVSEGPWLGSTFVSDTDPANQLVNFSQTVQVVPNRRYQFVAATYNRYTGTGTNQSYTATTIERTVGYNDTTVVNFR